MGRRGFGNCYVAPDSRQCLCREVAAWPSLREYGGGIMGRLEGDRRYLVFDSSGRFPRPAGLPCPGHAGRVTGSDGIILNGPSLRVLAPGPEAEQVLVTVRRDNDKARAAVPPPTNCSKRRSSAHTVSSWQRSRFGNVFLDAGRRPRPCLRADPDTAGLPARRAGKSSIRRDLVCALEIHQRWQRRHHCGLTLRAC